MRAVLYSENYSFKCLSPTHECLSPTQLQRLSTEIALVGRKRFTCGAILHELSKFANEGEWNAETISGNTCGCRHLCARC